MKFEVKSRCCFTRKGILSIFEREVETPAIFWYASKRIKAPEWAEVRLGEDIKAGGSFFYPAEGDMPSPLIYPHFFPEEFHEFMLSTGGSDTFQIVSGKIKKRYGGEKIYILANSMELYSNPRNFVNAIVNVRNSIGYSPLYAPAIALPYNIPVLAYMGIDIFDSLATIMMSREGYLLSSEHFVPSELPFEEVLMHNYKVMEEELRKTRHAIQHGWLRSLAESRAMLYPELASMIRLFDEEHYEFAEKRWPVNGGQIKATCMSLNRADIRRFRERVISRYRKPESAKILLLLPCSARKPYSASKSHRLFRKVINESANKNVIHEVILTSPLGIVPRELENFYPAMHYDISVTGKWSEDEKKMLLDMLNEYLRINDYDVIINHLPPEMDFVDIGRRTAKKHVTSEESLKMLQDALRVSEEYEYVHHGKRRYDNAHSMLLFQFGKSFIEGCNVKGRFPGYRIFCDDKQIAAYVQSRGMFSLTLAGADRIKDSYWVEIDDFIPKGSVFAAGIKNASDEIRSGDEVVVIHNEEIRAVGVAVMNGEEMVRSRRGEAIKTRHHI
ncbi:MAG: DUF5591 domain-containing protein [Thermoplasmata archaeon]|nr:DUF5591 domain-containing protein [Thermoplasmata archaeon]